MNRRVRNNSALKRKYENEPKVEVMGSTMYKPYLGSRYTFTFNGFPVSIEFNGKPQKYPATIAKVLQRKLNEIAEANAPKNVDTQLYI
jgi:hypothetical protein